MPYKRLLDDLVRTVPGASGALLLDSEGEVVVEAGARDARTRLIGAYQGIALATARRALTRYGRPAIDSMVCRYDRATILMRPLKDGYFFVLALAPGSGVGEALWRSAAVRDRMNEEI